MPSDYYERVKQQHQTGGHGSIGYRTVFKKEEAYKNLLRTHTTGIYICSAHITHTCYIHSLLLAIFTRTFSLTLLLTYSLITAISAQMLYKLANQEGGFTPQKYFSIDRVFRNESMDKTHLCEFHQVEGI